ncbi:ABC transporter permease [Microbacterium sp. NPDC058342]|uniref:ABC transporter permease n=1 Tax=Microbacterium sp. NPDC058342 TaxID=3346454 RepID=UPI00364CDB1F
MTLTIDTKTFRRKTPTGDARKSGFFVALVRAAVILALLGLWELGAANGWINELYVSRPSAIVTAMIGQLSQALTLDALGATVVAVLVAFVIGSVIGILLGIGIASRPILKEAYMPVVMLILSAPKSVFLPMLMILFGLRPEAAIAFGAILAAVYVTVNMAAAMELVQPRYFRVARAYGAPTRGRLIHIVLPAATPGIFTALWHGLRNAFEGVVVAQLFAGTVGVGALVRTFSNTFRTDQALALIFLVSISIIIVGTLWARAERRLTRWRTLQA